MFRITRPAQLLLAAFLGWTVCACAPTGAGASGAARSGEPASIHLSDRFDEAIVEGEVPEVTDLLVIDWRFDRPWEELPPEESEEPEEPEEPAAEDAPEEKADDEEPVDPETLKPGVIVHGAEALCGIEDLAVTDGMLRGRVTARSALRIERLPEGDDVLHGVEVRMRVSAGKRVGVMIPPADKPLDRPALRERIDDTETWRSSATLTPGGEFATYLIELSSRQGNTEHIRHLLIQPSDEVGATFEIESVRLVSRREHLALQAANFDWRGLGEIYRQTLLMHATESVTFDLVLPSRPWLELALGTTEAYPTTFVVQIAPFGSSAPPERLLRRTVTTENRWEETPLDLAAWAGKRVRLSFDVDSDQEEQVGFLGTLVVRNRRAEPSAESSPLDAAPRGVILVLADTLRPDHLDAYGYERDTAPFLNQLASEGALFEDNLAQGTWTKVSVTSILSSLYPSSSGVKKMPDKLPESVTTLAENFQQAGYSTFATSSVVFSGRNSNLQQGVDVLHERGSISDLEHKSKTARTYVDRLASWIETQHDQPFFAFLHVFDPHSPFETYNPYGGMWSEDGAREAHEKDLDAIREKVDDINRGGGDPLPDTEDFEKAGIPTEPFVVRERAWYDESIRAMDAEIERLMERLEELGLADDTVIVFTSDHGEEFLEHGRHFHGNNAYGELTHVPLMFWGERWVPAGVRIEQTVQSLDLYPTLLELCGLPVPEGPQGRSLVPLMRGSAEFNPRPAFSARFPDKPDEPKHDDIGSFAMVSDGYRLVHNVVRPEDHPEYELYDHEADPLNLKDIASDMPDRVEAMAAELALWRKYVEANRIENDGEAVELSEEDAAQLRALGYAGDD